MKIICKCCNEEIKGFIAKKIVMFGGKVKVTLHEECYEKYTQEIKDKYLIEVYRNNEIYEFNGEFVPYMECNYFYKSLEECKGAIDYKIDNKVASIDMSTFNFMNKILR